MDVFRFSLLSLVVTAAIVAQACSDQSLHTLPDDPQPGLITDDDDDNGGDDPGVDDDDTGAPYDDGQPDDDDVGIDEPPPWRDDCPPEALQVIDFYGPNGETEIYVLDSSPTEATATLVAPVAGLYAVYDTAINESGGSQTNETGFIRIRNDDNPEGLPTINNCGDEFIVQDNDNTGTPPAPLIYLGTFTLVEGDNDLTLHHFCPLYLDGQCQEFHIGDPADQSACGGNGPNSLHMTGDAICLIPR